LPGKKQTNVNDRAVRIPGSGQQKENRTLKKTIQTKDAAMWCVGKKGKIENKSQLLGFNQRKDYITNGGTWECQEVKGVRKRGREVPGTLERHAPWRIGAMNLRHIREIVSS